MADARSGAQADLESFLTGRLALILLPVHQVLFESGEPDLARLVGTAVEDIGLNIARILERYHITDRGPGCSA